MTARPILPAQADASRGTGWTGPRLGAALALAAAVLCLLGFAAGGEGLSFDWRADAELIAQIRAPRTLGALLAGALLGLAGALAQGLFRNPLADPYLLGSASGAGLGVVAVLAASGLAGHEMAGAALDGLQHLGLVGAAFLGALGGVGLTLMLARGAGQPMVLLLCGVVVGVLLGALSEALTLLAPQTLRGRQVFMLGTTSFLDWGSACVLALALALALAVARRFARVLDALVLGESTARSLGLHLVQARLVLVVAMALATGVAVAQVGLVAFVGLAAPHLVRRTVTVSHGGLIALSALSGGVLLLAADVVSRCLIAPQELPVGLLTAIIGGAYLLRLVHRRLRDGAA